MNNEKKPSVYFKLNVFAWNINDTFSSSRARPSWTNDTFNLPELIDIAGVHKYFFSKLYQSFPFLCRSSWL